MKGYSIFDQNLSFALGSILVLTVVYAPVGFFSFRTFFDKARRRGALATY